MPVIPGTWEAENNRMWLQTGSDKNQKQQASDLGGTSVVQCLHTIHQVLGSIPSTTHTPTNTPGWWFTPLIPAIQEV
jgi:hypothetical protein